MKPLQFAWPVAAALVLSLPARSQQNPAAKAQFEVASLKPAGGCENAPRRPQSLTPSPDRLEMPCVTLQSLIQTAFGTFGDGATINSQPLPTEGGPSWMRSEYYTLSAKAELPERTEMLAGPMLQALLQERFQLKTHFETRSMPVYVMTLEKGGMHIQALPEDGCTPLDLAHPPPPPKPGEPAPNPAAL